MHRCGSHGRDKGIKYGNISVRDCLALLLVLLHLYQLATSETCISTYAKRTRRHIPTRVFKQAIITTGIWNKLIICLTSLQNDILKMYNEFKHDIHLKGIYGSYVVTCMEYISMVQKNIKKA